MIEAQLCGVPVLALRRGSVPEVVQDGVTGLVGDDPCELIAGARVADKLFDRRRIRALARERWSAERMASQYLHLYRRRPRSASPPPTPGTRDRRGRSDADPDTGGGAARLRRSDQPARVDRHREAGLEARQPVRGDRRLGDIFPAGARDQGAYFEDTRFLSTLKLAIAGGPPVVLSTQGSAEYTSQIDLTVTSTLFGGLFADPVNFLHLRREQMMDDQFVERLTLTNFLVHEVDYWIEYEFAVDFADQFEVRGARRRDRGTYFRPRVSRDRVIFAYQGRDGVVYRSEVFFPVRARTCSSPERPASASTWGPTRARSSSCMPSPRCTRCARASRCASRRTRRAAPGSGPFRR